MIERFAGGFEEGELPAGGHDVLAARVADEDGIILFEEDALEFVDAGGIGAVVGQVARIPRDEIYFGAKAG